MKRSVKFLAVLLAVMTILSAIPAFAEGEAEASLTYLQAGEYSSMVDDVTVFEFKLPKYKGEGLTERYAAVTLYQRAQGVDYNLDLVTVDPADGKIYIGSEGEYYALCYSDGSFRRVGDNPLTVAVVYDDINGVARYIVNGALSYVVKGGELILASDLPVFDPAFAQTEYVSTITCSLFAGLGEGDENKLTAEDYALNTCKVNDRDTAEILGFQENSITDELRIIAGVDTLYYDSVGFEMEAFVGGISKGKTDISHSTVFASVVANDKTLEAKSMGYSYFAAANITKLPKPILENSYIAVRSYAEVNGVKRYDDAVVIRVTDDGYYFDKEGTVYENNFNGLEELPAEWKTAGFRENNSVALTENGEIEFVEPNHSRVFYYLDRYVGENYLFQADVTVRANKHEGSYFSMVYGYNNLSEFGHAYVRINDLVSIEAAKGGKWDVASAEKSFLERGINIELGEKHTYTLISRNGKVSLFIDGIPVSEGELSNAVSGKIGFASSGLDLLIDNVIVRTTDGIADDLLFVDTFDGEGDLPEGWSAVSGTSGYTFGLTGDGAFKVKEPNSAGKVFIADTEVGNDYVVQADFKASWMLNDGRYFGLVYRYTANNSYVTAGIRMNGAGWLEAAKTSGGWNTFATIDISKQDMSALKLSGNGEEYVYTLTAKVKGDSVSCYLNGTLIATGTLPAGYETGKVGFYVSGLEVEVDNFTVSKIDNTYGDYYLYEENFDSYTENTLPKNWKTAGSNSLSSVGATTDGKLRIVQPNGAWLIAYANEDLGTADYVLEADVKVCEFENTTRYFGLVVRYNNIEDFVHMAFRVNGEGWIQPRKGASWATSTKFNTTDESVGITPEVGGTYKLKAVCKGNKVDFYVNGIFLQTYDLGDNWKSGKVGVITSGVNIEVDNFLVHPYTEEDEVAEYTYLDLHGRDDGKIMAPGQWGVYLESGGTGTSKDGKFKATYGNPNNFIEAYAAAKDSNGNYLGYNAETGTNDYIVTTEITIDKAETTKRYFGLTLRYNAINNRIDACFRFNGDNGQGWIEARTPGGNSTLASFYLVERGVPTLEIGKTYVLKGICKGNEVSLYIDDILLASGTIPDTLKTGTAGISSKGMNYTADNFVITDVNDPTKVLYEQTFDGISGKWSTTNFSSGRVVRENEDGKIEVKTASSAAFSYLIFNEDVGYNDSTGYSDYVANARITIKDYASTNSSLGFVFRYTSSSSLVYVAAKASNSDGFGQVNNVSTNDGNSVPRDMIGINLKKYGIKLAKGSTHDFGLVAQGKTMKFYIDGYLIGEGTLSATSLSMFDVEKGKVGIGTTGMDFVIEEFTVQSIDGTLYDNNFDGLTAVPSTIWYAYESGGTVAANGGKITQTWGNPSHFVFSYVNKKDVFGNYLGYNHETGTNDYDYETEFTLTEAETTARYMGPVVRYTDTKNYIIAAFRINGEGWVQPRINGSWGATLASFNLKDKGITLEVGETYKIRTIVRGAMLYFYMNDILIAECVIPDSHKTGSVGLATKGVNIAIDNTKVKAVAGDLYQQSFNGIAVAPGDWKHEAAAARNGITPAVYVASNALDHSNGELILGARNSTFTVIALDKLFEYDSFVYEADITMLHMAKDISGVSYKMGPVFGLQDNSTSVGVNTTMTSGKIVVEAWLTNKYTNPNNPSSNWINFGSSGESKMDILKTYRYRVVGENNTVSIYIDGVLRYTCEITDPYMQGRFGIAFRNAVLRVDNVFVGRTIEKYEISEKESEDTTLRIATFNIGDFSTASGSSGDGISKGNGTEVTKQEYIDVFKKVGADLWGLQEDSPYFNGTTKELPYDAIYHEIHPTYKREFSGTYNGKAFLSGYEIYDVKKINYAMGELNESQATGYGHPWFLTGKVMIEGKEVAIATLHFDWSCKEMRANQIEQVIAWAKQYEYAMIIGDVNPDDCIGIPSQKADGTWQNHTVLSSESTHLVDNKRFTDAGFVQANGGKFGTFYTIMKNGVPRSQSPCDNIFVSPNIEMVNAEVVYEPWMNDHAIVVADIKIK